MPEPRFLSLDQVFEIHRSQLASFGGQEGVRDQAALESALGQPEAGFGEAYLHSFPFGMAAAYAFHLAENQPFVDGNKRAALDCALTFLDVNDILLEDPDMALYQAMIDMGSKKLSKKGLEDVLRTLSSRP